MQAMEEVWVNEITQLYGESLVSSMPRHNQAVIDNKGGHNKYWKLVTVTLLDAIKFQTVLYSAFCEINLCNLVRRQTFFLD